MRNNSIIIASSAALLAIILRDKLRNLDIQAVTVTENDRELMDRIKSGYPRFVLLENCFHEPTEEYVLRLAKRYRDLRIVVWSASGVKPIIAARYILAGAESFFSLRDTDETIEDILQRIISGQRYYPAEVSGIVDTGSYLPTIGGELTIREIEIIKLCVNGQNNYAIAETLGIKHHTVKAHKLHIYRKCGGNTPVDILRYGLQQGVICPEDLGAGKGEMNDSQE
jgi:DNA-binding NarL/FixJ family response regulator